MEYVLQENTIFYFISRLICCVTWCFFANVCWNLLANFRVKISFYINKHQNTHWFNSIANMWLFVVLNFMPQILSTDLWIFLKIDILSIELVLNQEYSLLNEVKMFRFKKMVVWLKLFLRLHPKLEFILKLLRTLKLF